MNWSNFNPLISPYVVRIRTKNSSGTGFVCTYSDDKHSVVIATAYHVIESTRINNGRIWIDYPDDQTIELLPKDRTILFEYDSDVAVILTKTPESDVVPKEKPKCAIGEIIPSGTEVGWLGYPWVGGLENTKSFFSGHISAFQEPASLYCIDGVAINGVSGSPVYFPSFKEGGSRITIIGIMTSYFSNLVGSESRPGISKAVDITKVNELLDQ